MKILKGIFVTCATGIDLFINFVRHSLIPEEPILILPRAALAIGI